MEWQTIVATIAALTALVSAVIGPVVALRIAKFQIHASVASNERKEWLDALRKDLGIVFSAVLFNTTTIGESDSRINALRTEKTVELHQAAVRVTLRLDSGDELHCLLDKAIGKLVEGAGKEMLGEKPEIPVHDAYNVTHEVAKKIIGVETKRLSG
jgi:hypothetical protein